MKIKVTKHELVLLNRSVQTRISQLQDLHRECGSRVWNDEEKEVDAELDATFDLGDWIDQMLVKVCKTSGGGRIRTFRRRRSC